MNYKPIKIGDRDYIVKRDANLASKEGCHGQILYRDMEIVLQKDINPKLEPPILVHEAVHGLLEFLGERPLNDNEPFVHRLSNGLCMLVRDNPALFNLFINPSKPQ